MGAFHTTGAVLRETHRPLRAGAATGDFLYSVQASFNHLWLSAALGCPIRVTEATIWSEPPGLTIDAIADQSIDIDYRWIDKLVECHRSIVSHVGGRAAVAVPWLDGPLDLMVSLLGAERTALELVDNPALFEKSMEWLTDFVVETTRQIACETPGFAEGYVSRMHIYTSEPSPTVMDDATWMVSPENYARYVYPFEKRIIDAFPGSVYHMHNTSTQIMPALSDTALQAVQYTVDPNGPDWAVQRAAIASLQKVKPVVLSCWTIEDAERARVELVSRGLAITVVVDTMPDRSPEPRMLEGFLDWYHRIVR